VAPTRTLAPWSRFRRPSAISLLAVLGITIGTANIIALISVTDTARWQSFALLRDVGARSMFVMPFVGGQDTNLLQRSNAAAFLPKSYAEALRGLPQLDKVAALMMMPAHVSVPPDEAGPAAPLASQPGAALPQPSTAPPEPGTAHPESAPPASEDNGSAEDGRVLTIIEGANPDYPAARGHRAGRGRYVTWADEAMRARVCCLGYTMPKQFFGDADPLGRHLLIKGERFTVVGVMIEKGVVGLESFDERIFIPLSTAQEMWDLPGEHFIIVRVADNVSLKDARLAAEARLRQAAGLAPGEPADFTISTVEELTGLIDSTLRIFHLLLYGISSVALLVAGIGIMNVMLMQIIERTREIGVRRAVGARRRDILAQFILEALGQVAFGTVIGALLGIGAAVGFCYGVKWTPHVSVATVVLAIAFASVVSMVFGVFPAVHAALLKPIDCLRHE